LSVRTPHDLALFVYGRLNDDEYRPSVEVLDALFQTIFLTTMKTEEGMPIVCSVAFVDPKNPDPEPPALLRDPRWRYIPLDNPVEYSVGQLAKMAMATDPSSSCLGVYPDQKGRMKIWGLFDQQGGYQSLLKHEAEGGWAPPGIIQAQALGLGHIIVTAGFAVIAELNGGILVEDAVDVFKGSIILQKLTAGFERRFAQIDAGIKERGYHIDSNYKSSVLRGWVDTLRRLLLRARAFGHGGAFLITDSDCSDRLKIKYGICYGRIPALFENWMRCRRIARESTPLYVLDEPPDYIDFQQVLETSISEDDVDDAKEAMAGAVGFVASLTRVDGLVLLDTDLIVHGFGCEIIAQGDDNCSVFQANNSRPTKGRLHRLDPQRFGTRHRSMLRYCSEDESSIGFVVSKDGPVRAISRSGKRVYFWDNVQLSYSRPFKRD
jgi:hypothetical protein